MRVSEALVRSIKPLLYQTGTFRTNPRGRRPSFGGEIGNHITIYSFFSLFSINTDTPKSISPPSRDATQQTPQALVFVVDLRADGTQAVPPLPPLAAGMQSIFITFLISAMHEEDDIANYLARLQIGTIAIDGRCVSLDDGVALQR